MLRPAFLLLESCPRTVRVSVSSTVTTTVYSTVSVTQSQTQWWTGERARECAYNLSCDQILYNTLSNNIVRLLKTHKNRTFKPSIQIKLPTKHAEVPNDDNASVRSPCIEDKHRKRKKQSSKILMLCEIALRIIVVRKTSVFYTHRYSQVLFWSIGA